MAWPKPDLCAMWHVLAQFRCHVACHIQLPYGMSYIVTIWHVLNLKYVPCDMAQPSLGDVWHVIGLTHVPCGMDKFNFSVTWHDIGLALRHVACPILAQPRYHMACFSLVQMPCGMFQFSLGATWHVLAQLKCHVECLSLAQVPHGMAYAKLGAMWHAIDAMSQVPCGMA